MSSSKTLPSSNKLRFGLLAVLFSTIWSSAFIATKFGLETASPLSLAAARFIIAGVVMLGAARSMGRSLALSRQDALMACGIGLLINSLYLGLTFTALKTVSAGLVSILASMTPILTTFAGALWLGERPNGLSVCGLVLGVTGAAYIALHRVVAGTDPLVGILLALMGIAALVGGTILFKLLRTRPSLLVVNGYQLLAGGLAIAPFALLQPSSRHPVLGVELIVSLAYLSLVVSICGTLIWFYLLRRGSATAVNSYLFLTPAIGVLLSAAVLHEPVVAADILGLIPISIGIILVTRNAAFGASARMHAAVAARIGAGGHALPGS